MGSALRFIPVNGEGINIPQNDNHDVYKWIGGNVFFSASRRGNSLSVHVAAQDRQGKLKLRDAAKEFVDWCFSSCDWCEYVLAPVSIKNKSVVNLTKKIGFEHFGDILDSEDVKIVVMGIKRGNLT